MKIRPKIQKFQLGDKFKWYKDIYEDYNPYRYTSTYDTERGLVAGDIRNGIQTAWSSNIAGTDPGRYTPTNLPKYNQFGKNFSHYKYASEVEKQPYYQNFENDLVDSNGNLTEVGLQWAKDVDKLLPEGHSSRLLNPDGSLKDSWTVKLKDAHGRTPVTRTFTKANLKEFIHHLRNDQTIGARHNLYLKRGKRYFYVDDEGQYHWVDPNKIEKYQVSEKPVEQGWEGDTYWDDYELTGLKNTPIQKKEDDEGGSVKVNPYTGTTFNWDKIQEGFRKMYPELLGLGRLAGTLASNEKIYGEALKGIRPDLKQSYLTHRQVVGDEATKQAYYRRAAQGQTRAARPFTADADRQMAYQMEAKRIGDELRAQGDLADNAEIRRTSDESNQHQWANTQRNTEVANANIAALNYANSLKHNLLAQKHASNWSSINNYLLEKETRARQAEEEDRAIQNQIYALDETNKLATDSRYNELYEKALKDINAGLTTSKNITDFRNYRTQLEITRLRNMPRRNSGFFLFAKRGASLEYKKKDDLLYRTARDVVDHFRRISKHASDSYNRRPIKLEKLTSHPKGSTKKYQQGGLAPFVVYTPAPIGGETKISSSLDGEKSGSKKDESLELVKNLFKEIGGNGLPVDVSLVFDNLQKLFNKHKILGTEMTTEDIQSVYVQAMQQLSHIKYSQDSFNKLEQLATSNEALSEFAVTSDGRYVVSDENGNLSYEKSWENILKEGKNPITNQQLLNLRAYSPKLALQKGDIIIDNVIANGMGINKIGAQIKALAGSLGTSEGKLDGISQVESGKVKQGLQILANAPDGYYKHTIANKTQREQVNAALNYIEHMLSPSQRAILDTHGGTKPLIASFLTSQSSATHDTTIQPLTGKAASNSSNSGNYGDIKSSFLDQVQRDQIGISRKFSLITKDGNTELYSLNSKYVSQLPNVTSDMSLDQMLASSNIGAIMDSRYGVTFGDQVIDPSNFKDIMFDLGGGATIVTLPCKIVNGHKVVNLAIKDDYDKAVKEVSKDIPINYQNPQFVQALANKLHEKGLDSLLSGNNLNPEMFGHFIVVSAYTSDKVKFDTNSRYVERVKNPDEDLENRIISALSTNKDKDNYELDIDNHWGFLEGFWDDIYRGSIFIPINNDPVSAQIGNSTIKLDEVRGLAEDYQNYQKLNNQRSSSSDIL